MRRLPFFTPLALVSASGTLAVVALVLWSTAGAPLSPGALAARSGDGVRRGGVASHEGLARRCGACHPAPWSSATTSDRCLACHDDIREPLALDQGLHARLGDVRRCLACHTEHRGRDGELTRLEPATFPHGATGFALEGKHAGLTCESCHQRVGGAMRYSDAPERCVGCHRDDDAHAGRLGDDCGRCHTATAWLPAEFDHAKTKFALTGAHVRVACADCHAEARYQGTPSTCVSCHAMPADHRGTFGDDCAGCHGTDSWTGARFDHRFPVDHGADRPVPCATCHPDGYRGYTCYGCHEHTPARMERKHRDEGITDLRDCARCHPTGREGEGEGEHGGRGGHGGEGDDDD